VLRLGGRLTGLGGFCGRVGFGGLLPTPSHYRVFRVVLIFLGFFSVFWSLECFGFILVILEFLGLFLSF
jgi:hypothetical protein